MERLREDCDGASGRPASLEGRLEEEGADSKEEDEDPTSPMISREALGLSSTGLLMSQSRLRRRLDERADENRRALQLVQTELSEAQEKSSELTFQVDNLRKEMITNCDKHNCSGACLQSSRNGTASSLTAPRPCRGRRCGQREWWRGERSRGKLSSQDRWRALCP